MQDMKLGKEKQLSFRSTPDIVARLDLAAAKLAVTNDFAGDKLRTGHVVNAVALWLGELPDDEMVAFVRPKLEALATYLGRSEDADGIGFDGAGDATIGRSMQSESIPTDDDSIRRGGTYHLGGTIRSDRSKPKAKNKPPKSK